MHESFCGEYELIQQVYDMETVELIVRGAVKIVGVDRNALKRMILGSLLDDQKFIMADREGDKLRAFMFATIENLNGEDVCFIQSCYSDKKDAVQQMLEKCIKWSKGLDIKRIVFMTQRSPNAWARKYKFKLKSYVMEREI